MKRTFLFAFILLLIVPSSNHALDVSVLGGTAGGECSTVIDSQTEETAQQNIYGDNISGVISGTVSSADVVCGITFKSYDCLTSGTLTCRIGTSADLTSGYQSGSLAVSDTDDNVEITVELDSTITGSTVYHFACSWSNAAFGDRIRLYREDDSPGNAYSVTDGDWDLTGDTSYNRLYYKLLKQ